MSIRTSIYKHLASDPLLLDMLADKPAEIGTGPGIYETWAAPGARFPYVNLTYSWTAGDHQVKRNGILNVDIFSEGYDTTHIEAIETRIIDLLDFHYFNDSDVGPVRIYLDNQTDIPEDEENILHWNITFTVIHWRKSFIERRTAAL